MTNAIRYQIFAHVTVIHFALQLLWFNKIHLVFHEKRWVWQRGTSATLNTFLILFSLDSLSFSFVVILMELCDTQHINHHIQ